MISYLNFYYSTLAYWFLHLILKNKFKDQISIKYFFLFKYQKNETKIRKNINDDIIEAKKLKGRKIEKK